MRPYSNDLRQKVVDAYTKCSVSEIMSRLRRLLYDASVRKELILVREGNQYHAGSCPNPMPCVSGGIFTASASGGAS